MSKSITSNLRGHFSRWPLAVAVASLSGAAGAGQYNLKAQSLADALLKFSEKSGVEIILPSLGEQQLKSPGLSGEYTVEQGLDLLLSKSDFKYRKDKNNVYIVYQDDEKNSEDSDVKKDELKENVEEIVVTGSRIARVSSQLAANVITLDAAALRASGEATLEGALRQLPQNIFGASPVGAAVSSSGISFNGAMNISGASSINLRGLGAESTLVLIDGKRIGKAGVFGGVSDITGIPLSSVERVEIMLDGASSIYGSDAVGGVVNVITKKDFEGGEVSYEYASSELGGFSEHVFSISASKAWDGGRIRGTLERYHHTNLDGGERPDKVSTQSSQAYPASLSPSGLYYFRRGSEVRTRDEWLETYSYDELIAMVKSGEMVNQRISLPPNQDGTDLTFEDLIISDSTGTIAAPGVGISLLPKQTRTTLSLGFDQQFNLFGQALNLSGTLYYSDRDTYASTGNFGFSARLAADDPTNPLPGYRTTISWAMPQGWADQHYQTEEEVVRWNLSLDGDIGDSWRWDMAVGQSKTALDSLYFNESLPYWEPEFQDLLDDGLNVLAGDLIAANTPELLQHLVVPETDTVSVNTENTVDISADGRLLSLPGGDVHLAIGGGWRQEGLESGTRNRVGQSFLDGNEIGNIGYYATPGVYDDTEVSRTQRSLYTELLVPVVGADNALPGVQRLNLTGSARYDSYHEQGSDSTWSLGLIWNPIDQLMIRARHSTSYVVPTFRSQLIPTRVYDWANTPQGRPYALVDANGVPTGETEYLGRSISGGNPDLNPERASTLTAGIEITPDILPGFTFSADWYQTQYENRISSAPSIAEIRFVPTLGTHGIYADTGYDTKYGSVLYRGENGSLVWDQREVNIAQVDRAGVDYQVRYNRNTNYGQFIATANITYNAKYDTVRNPGDEPVNQIADVSFQSRSVVPAYIYSAQLQWSYRGFWASLSANASSETTSEGQLGASEVLRISKAPMLMALTMSYDVDEGNLFNAPTWLQGTVIALKIPRLLNQTGEYRTVDRSTGEPYVFAGMNANTTDFIGRKFHLSLTKRF